MKITKKDCDAVWSPASPALLRAEKDFGIKVLEFYYVLRPKKHNFYSRLFLFEQNKKTGIAYCVSNIFTGIKWNVGVVKYTDSLIAKIVLKKLMNGIKEYSTGFPSPDVPVKIEKRLLGDVHYFDEDWAKPICETVTKRKEKLFGYAASKGAWQKIKNEVGGIY
jgi:hypothetical protein